MMRGESHTTRAVLRDRSVSLNAPPEAVSRLVRRLLSGPKDSHGATSQFRQPKLDKEIEQLMAAGLWPPQTCQQERRIRNSKRAFDARTAASKGKGEEWESLLSHCDGGSLLTAAKEEAVEMKREAQQQHVPDEPKHSESRLRSSAGVGQRATHVLTPAKTMWFSTTGKRATAKVPGGEHRHISTKRLPVEERTRLSWQRPMMRPGLPTQANLNEQSRTIRLPPPLLHMADASAGLGSISAGSTTDSVRELEEAAREEERLLRQFSRRQDESDNAAAKEPSWMESVREELEKKGVIERYQDEFSSRYVSNIAIANSAAKNNIPEFLLPNLENQRNLSGSKTIKTAQIMEYRNKEGLYHQALFALSTVVDQRIAPSIQAINAGMRACIKLGTFEVARALFNKYKSFAKPNAESIQLMLQTIIARRNLEAAREFVKLHFNDIVSREVLQDLLKGAANTTEDPDYVTWLVLWCWKLTHTMYPEYYESIIRAHLREGDFRSIQIWIRRMTEDGLEPEILTYSVILVAMVKNNKWDELETVLKHMQKRGMKIPTLTMNKIVCAVSDELSAENFDTLTRALGAEWNLSTWNIGLKIILRYSGDEELMLTVESYMNKMLEKEVKPDESTLNTILSRLWKMSPNQDGNLALRKCMAYLKRAHHELFNGKSIESYLGSMSKRKSSGRVRLDAAVVNEESYSTRMHASNKEGNHEKVLDLFYDIVFADKMRLSVRMIAAALQAAYYAPDWKAPTSAHADRFRKICSANDTTLHPSFEDNIGMVMIHGVARAHKWSIDLQPMDYSIIASDFDPTIPVDEAIRSISSVHAFFEANGLPCGFHYVTHVAGRMIRKRRHLDAIAVVRHFGASSSAPLDMHVMFLLVRAYVSLNDIDGLRWTVNQMVERRICPGEYMQYFLTKYAERMQAISSSSPSAKDSSRLVDELVESVTRLNEELKRQPLERTAKVLGLLAGEETGNKVLTVGKYGQEVKTRAIYHGYN